MKAVYTKVILDICDFLKFAILVGVPVKHMAKGRFVAIVCSDFQTTLEVLDILNTFF